MTEKKNIFVIIGSASSNSANLKLIEKIESLTENEFNLTIFNELKMLPHFAPELSTDNPPKLIVEFRNKIEKADGIIILHEVVSVLVGLIKSNSDRSFEPAEGYGQSKD